MKLKARNLLFFSICFLTAISQSQASDQNYRSLNFASSLSSEQCGEVLGQMALMGLNRTTDRRLNQFLDSLAVECGIGFHETPIQSEPVLYTFKDSELAILWDGRSLSVNERARLTVSHTFSRSFKNVQEIDPSHRAQTPQRLKVESKSQLPIEENDLGILDKLSLRAEETLSELEALTVNGEPHVIWSGIAYHDRRTYSPEQITEFNEKAWGIGFESVRTNKITGEREAVAAMIIRDSHRDPQFSFSYEWQKGFRVSQNIKLWGGYTAGLISRSDYSYFPIPFALPTAGVSIGKLNIKTVFIPKISGGSNGNVIFLFVSVPIETSR